MTRDRKIYKPLVFNDDALRYFIRLAQQEPARKLSGYRNCKVRVQSRTLERIHHAMKEQDKDASLQRFVEEASRSLPDP